ncbi:MAG: asparagine synthase (glutamine-hydrolyzing) [Bacteroidetes bacterium]|nr:asparagine synthase (glutamine-hydrolyzing) [Bacteroidota bacterium]
MCGFVGFWNPRDFNADDARSLIKRMTDTIIHRGPDDEGYYIDNDAALALGFRRLSIIDLSEAGHQPMHSHCGRYVIVFNGEIYNHRELRRELEQSGCRIEWRGHSDTETLITCLAEWGLEKTLTKLNGMFAFVLYDKSARKLFMARDRAGEKPLFYSIRERSICFASELKALMANPSFPRKIDKESLDYYLAYGYTPGDRCMLKGVNKLPPAHALEFSLETQDIKVWRYWEPPLYQEDANKKVDENELLEELESLLEDSVKRQMEADVPVGILLSGGVDSSLVTAMAVRSHKKVKTFTIGFPGYGKYDESEHARLIANHFGTEHIELEAPQTSLELLPDLARQFDEPIVDSSMIPTYLVSNLIKQHCTVALGGDGGDELFGGYQHYDRFLRIQHLLKLPDFVRSTTAFISGKLLPIGFKGRNWMGSLGNNCLSNGLPLIVSHMDCLTRQELLKNGTKWQTKAEKIQKQTAMYAGDIIQQATRMDFEHFLSSDILVKVDRASMLNSLEVRAPLLDYRLIEFAFGKVPSLLKTSASDRKVLLKKLTAKLLPKEFDQQRKQGFSIPLTSWLKEKQWQDFFQNTLLDSEDSFFNTKAVQKIFNGQLKGYANSERLFALVLLLLWRKEYIIFE